MNTVLARAAAAAADFFLRLRRAIGRRPVLWLAALPVLVLAYPLALLPFIPSIGDLRKAKSEQPTVVLSADGKELAVFKRANREWVKLPQMSPSVLAALISTEDHRFFQHHGIDLRRTASAVVRTVGGDMQGGSTITQQLARNLYPDEIGRAPTVTRKVKEALTALKIEAVYSKDEILETYLNTVPFLYNAYGIEMAARTYFDKSADTLDELESATLIGMLKGTSYYNPVLNPERAVQRRNTVLGQMVKHGKLTPAKFELLKKSPLGLDFERQTEPTGPAPHFAKQLRRWLVEWADRNGYNIHADGLVVRTTIDSRLQELASQALARHADRLQAVANVEWGPRAGWSANKDAVNAFVRESAGYRSALQSGLAEDQALRQLLADAAFMQTLRLDKTRLQAGFLALDPANGHVKAWVGSRDFTEDQFDHVQQARRQPGSTFKPFVYGAAFEAGAKPTDTLMDQAVEIQLGSGAVWRPSDVGEPSGRATSLRDGLAYSKNTITAQVMQTVGPAKVATLARAMGVRQSKLDQVPSLALGTSPVTLKEMVASYGTIANGGSYIEPVLVTRIEDRNRRVLEAVASPPGERAMSAAVAQQLLDALRGVIDRGTGVAIRQRFGIQADVAGKTGTTQNNTDGWFILMHPQLVAGAWVGFNDNRVTMGDSWGQGARSALPIVGEFFQQSLKASVIDPRARFGPAPQAGVLDPLLGQVNSWFSGMFPRNTEPAPEPEAAAEPPPRPETTRVPDVVVVPESQRPPEFERAPQGPAGSPIEVLVPEARGPRALERAAPAAGGSANMPQREDRREPADTDSRPASGRPDAATGDAGPAPTRAAEGSSGSAQ